MFLLTVTALLAGCGQQVPTPASSIASAASSASGAPTAQIAVIPVFPTSTKTGSAQQALSTQNSSAVQTAFADAKAVTPGQPWKIKGAKSPGKGADGYTLPFYDFYGVSFGYLTFADRDGHTKPADLIATAQRDTTADPSSPETWQVGTLLTGANTSRSVIGTFEHGVPVLDTLFGEAGKVAGFKMAEVDQYVMPTEGIYWAKMKDGRFYDLKMRAYVSSEQVQAKRTEYDLMVQRFVDNRELTRAKDEDKWKKASADNFVQIADAGTVTATATAQSNNTVTSQSYSFTCGRRTALFWSWEACDNQASTFRGDMTEYMDMSRASYKGDTKTYTNPNGWGGTFIGGYYYDEQRNRADGQPEGCGPVSVATVLKWYRDMKPYAWNRLPYYANPMDAGTDGYTSTVEQLVVDMLTWVPAGGGVRNTEHKDFIYGANAYLNRRSPASLLSFGGTYGQPSLNWEAQADIYKDKFSKNEPVIMMHGSNAVKHFGIVQKFEKGSWTDLMVFVPSWYNSWFNQSSTWYAYLTGAYAVYY
ncbi:hypothetical protein [Deinococcus peraridilitoris]|nr:hypothetical protein [Deinococcus peraridilitoris]